MPPADHAARVAGASTTAGRPGARASCARSAAPSTVRQGTTKLVVTPPSWRPDLADPNDLAEEVIRLDGYETCPRSCRALRRVAGSPGQQRAAPSVADALAGAGLHRGAELPVRRRRRLRPARPARGRPAPGAVKLANPLSDEEPAAATTLLPGLLGRAAAQRRPRRHDLAIFETGLVFRPAARAREAAPLPVRHAAPDDEEIQALNDALPDQPRHVAVVLATGPSSRPAGGARASPPTGPTRSSGRRTVADAAGAELVVRQRAEHAPWHPGRCAELTVVDGKVVGHAGELHPKVCQALGLPARTCAVELDLDVLEAAAPASIQGRPVLDLPGRPRRTSR